MKRPLRLPFRDWSAAADFDPIYGIATMRAMRAFAEEQTRKMREQMDRLVMEAIAGGSSMAMVHPNRVERVDPFDFYVQPEEG